MADPVGPSIRGAAAIMLGCAIISLGVAGQRVASGAEMAMPMKLAAGAGEQPLRVAAAAPAVGGGAAVQETKSGDAPAEPQAAAQEAKSVTRQPSRKQRRRKPKMAEVPAGSPVVAQETREPIVQAVTLETKKTDTPVKPRIEDQSQVEDQENEETDPFAAARPPATVQKTAETDPFAAAKPPAAAQETKPAEETKAVKSSKRYAIAPIRWGARVSETLGLLRESTTTNSSIGLTPSSFLTRKRTFSNTQTAEIKAASYIMQPYIAQVNGGLGVVSSRDNINTQTGMSGVASTDTRETNRDNKLFGSGALALFAKSRFPFSGSFSIADSRANSELTNDDTVTRNLSLQQSYRPRSGPSRYTGGYQLSSATSKNSGNYTYSGWNGGYSTRIGSNHDQPLYSSVRHTVSQSQQGGRLTTNILSAQHTYLPPDSLLSLNSSANFTQSAQSDPTQPNGPRARFLQLSTFASWQPEAEDVPLFLTGSGRYFGAVTSFQGASAATKSLGGNVSATYDASDNLKYNGDMSATRSISAGTGAMVMSQSGRAIYRSDTIRLENKSAYFWTTNGGATNQIGGQAFSGLTSNPVGVTGFNPRGFAGIGHSLNGPVEFSFFGSKPRLTYSINQDVSGNLPLSDNASLISSKSSTLRNSAGLLSAFGKEQTSGMASATVTDIKTTGGVNPGHTRSVAIQLNGQGKQPIYEGYGAKADASVQVTRAPNGQMETSGAAVGTYVKYGIFGVSNLSYQGRLDITVQPSSATGTTNAVLNNGAVAERKPVFYSLDQHLSYRIGMNEARITAYLDDQYGVKHASLLLQLRAWRNIGN